LPDLRVQPILRLKGDNTDQFESGHTFASTLAPYLVASAGGLPILVDGKVIGTISVSGSPTGLIGQAAAQAGVDALK
jgi:uncharacterized protein GlcG (DUF336 family)